jgi:hypothetical protein
MIDINKESLTREGGEGEGRVATFLIILGVLMNDIAEFTQTNNYAQTIHAAHQNAVLL